jgi:hypothetical protein
MREDNSPLTLTEVTLGIPLLGFTACDTLELKLRHHFLRHVEAEAQATLDQINDLSDILSLVER